MARIIEGTAFARIAKFEDNKTEQVWKLFKKVSPNTINQCYHYHSTTTMDPLGSSRISYRGHRAFGTVAVSIVNLCSYTVTSAVT